MTAVPFDWIPSAMPEPESCAPSWAMNATSATRLTRTMRGDGAGLRRAFDDRREDITVIEPVDRLADRVRERRADGDHDLGRIRAARRLPDDHDELVARAAAGAELRRVDDVRERLQRFPAVALEPVAGARAPCTRSGR